jgi:RNA polymerase sigma factor (sigma-70 family)
VNPKNSEHSRWFAEEVQPHEPALRAYLHGRFPNLQDIDDVLQDVYVRLIQARYAGKIRQPKAYLFTMARNAALDLFRRKQIISIENVAEMDRLSVVEDRPDAAETASHDQEMEILTQAIKALPERCREVLTLRRVHGLSYRDIASKLGISENTVNAQLAIGLLRCREYLCSRGVVNKHDHAIHPIQRSQ